MRNSLDNETLQSFWHNDTAVRRPLWLFAMLVLGVASACTVEPSGPKSAASDALQHELRQAASEELGHDDPDVNYADVREQVLEMLEADLPLTEKQVEAVVLWGEPLGAKHESVVHFVKTRRLNEPLVVIVKHTRLSDFDNDQHFQSDLAGTFLYYDEVRGQFTGPRDFARESNPIQFALRKALKAAAKKGLRDTVENIVQRKIKELQQKGFKSLAKDFSKELVDVLALVSGEGFSWWDVLELVDPTGVSSAASTVKDAAELVKARKKIYKLLGRLNAWLNNPVVVHTANGAMGNLTKKLSFDVTAQKAVDKMLEQLVEGEKIASKRIINYEGIIQANRGSGRIVYGYVKGKVVVLGKWSKNHLPRTTFHKHYESAFRELQRLQN